MTCERCGHEWTPRKKIGLPIKCSLCQNNWKYKRRPPAVEEAIVEVKQTPPEPKQEDRLISAKQRAMELLGRIQ